MEMNSLLIGKLSEALAKAQGLIVGAEKDGNNPFHKSQYTTLASVWDACRKPLSQNGLAVIQTMDYQNERPVLVTTLSHISGEFVRSVIPLLAVKMDSQALGSAITYARRYALAAIVGVCPADDSADVDDDAEKAMGRSYSPAPKVSQPTKEPKPLSDKQEAFLDSLVLQVELIDESYIAKVKEHLGVKSIYDVDSQQFDVAIKAFQKRIKAHKEESDESASVA